MPDEKTFRRRRAVFLLLVLAAFVLLTGSFVGAFGGAERGLAGVVSPIQEGASKVAKPGRDLVNWVGDTFRAKGDLSDVRAERDRLAIENSVLRQRVMMNGSQQQLAELAAPYARYGPVEVSPISQSASAWYRTIKISKGTSDGIAYGNPVIAPNGLIGMVISAQSGTSIVRLITDGKSGVTAEVARTDDKGPLRPSKVGTVGDLILEIPKSDRFRDGDTVVTAGSTSQRLESRFPPAIPIGTITKIEDQNADSQVVHVTPSVDLRRLPDVLMVLRTVEDARP
ncbi:MAG: rod shape-determining protein MreC [Solirubrobacteraceae bacterium]|nr:rod shape-determining protein MreC [Solirubrobacteraceae bacterium]